MLCPSAGGVGRTSQAKNEGNTIGQGRWPVKSCEFLVRRAAAAAAAAAPLLLLRRACRAAVTLCRGAGVCTSGSARPQHAPLPLPLL